MDLQTVVDLKPLIDALLSAVGVVLLSAAAWAVKWALFKLKLEADEKIRNTLLDGVHSAIDYAINRAKLGAGARVDVDLHDKMLADAGKYLVDRFPDAVKHFGLDGKALGQIIEARLPPIGSEAAPAPMAAVLTGP